MKMFKENWLTFFVDLLSSLGITCAVMTSLFSIIYFLTRSPLALQLSILSSSLSWLIILDKDIASRIMDESSD
jgi:hypothetical protein